MRRGFTLVELLIVLAILSVTVAILIPTFSLVSTAQVSIAAKDSLRMMRYARNMALQTQQPITLTFSPGQVAITSPLDGPAETDGATDPEPSANDKEPSDEADDATRRKLPPYRVDAGGGIDTVALTKAYEGVAFQFLGYEDSVGRSWSNRPSDFTRHGMASDPSDSIEEPSAQEAETFSITVRTNGTTRPFSIRVYEAETEMEGDIVAFDFLCSGTIGDGD